MATRLVIAALDIGPHTSPSDPTPLEIEDWGILAAACLAAIARGFTRPLKEVTRKTYTAYWESLEDNSQRNLDEGENPEFHSLLQRLKATSQHLDIHINADEADGMQKWTRTVRKEMEETARRAASAEVEIALYNWKTDQLLTRQQQLEEDLKKTILERNVDLLRNTATTLGLTIGDSLTPPHSRPVPTTGNKRTASGSTPQPARTPDLKLLPSVPDVSSQTPSLDIITLTAAVQTAMQPFMARLAAIESSTAIKNRPGVEIPDPGPRQAQTREHVNPTMRQTATDRQQTTAEMPPTEEEWVQVQGKRKRGKKGKEKQADPTPQQINLTPQSYASAVTTTPPAGQPATRSQPAQTSAPLLQAFTEVTVVRFGGSVNAIWEQATRIRQPDAIVREVKANMARAVAKPLPIVSGRWSSGTRSKGNFVFTMRGQVDFAFIQSFEHFFTGPFPGGGQLCPNQGWTKLIAHGVPAMDNKGDIFGPKDLLQEVKTMQGLRNVYFSSPPRWIKPVDQISSYYTSLTFAFSDPDGSTTKQLLKERQALFGKQVQIERWVDKPLLIQCGRCHTLGHAASSKVCRLPPDSVKCYICDKGHLADAHDRECTRSKQHKVAGTCNCRLQCLICNKIGHHTRDRICPARDGFCSQKLRSPDSKGKEKERNPPDLPPETTPQWPVPPIFLELGQADNSDTAMLEAEEACSSNHIPQDFLPGPDLTQDQAFDRMAACTEESLVFGGPVTITGN